MTDTPDWSLVLHGGAGSIERHRLTPAPYVLNVAKARNNEKSAVMSHSGNTTLHTTPMLTPRSRHGWNSSAMS